MSARLRTLALFPEPPPENERGRLLWNCVRTRALRSWIKPGAYAWFIFDGQLKAQQRKLVALRNQPESTP